MKTVRVSDAKARLSEIVNDIISSHEMYQISKDGLPAAVILSQQEYDELLETLDILSDTKLMEKIRKSRLQAKKGKLLSHKEIFGEDL